MMKVNIDDDASRQSFEREAEYLSYLRHPNVLSFFGAGEEQKSVGALRGLPFIVTELAEKGSLRDVSDSVVFFFP